MNSEEGVSLAKMAVTVLLVVLVIGAVVAIVYAAYSWFSSGSDKLGNQVTSIDKSSYSQYDDSQVSGTDVLSALKTYRESDIAIFVCNSAKGGYSTSSTVKVNDYCALITGAKLNASKNYEVSLTQDSGRFTCADYSYDEDGITPLRNTNFSPTTTTANTDAFVKQSAKWYANLVYSETTGDVAGILFRQMN